jgi:hypothetical protein
MLHKSAESVLEELLALRIPRPDIPGQAVPAIAWTVALPTVQEVRQVFRIDVLKQFLFVTASDDFDLFGGLFVEPRLDHHPDA